VSKDLTFRKFLRYIFNELKRQHKDPCPYVCLPLEFTVNLAVLVVLLLFVHPVSLIFTTPWLILRLLYWLWRIDNE